MNKILVIVGNFSPNPSSVANCLEPLLNKMGEKGFQIDIVTNRRDLNSKEYSNINGLNIYRVDDVRVIVSDMMHKLEKLQTSWELNILSKLFSFFIRSCYLIRFCTFTKERGTGGWRLKEIVKKCCKLHDINHYDAVLSVSQPFKSHYVADAFLDQIPERIKWFVFEFDPFSYNKELFKSQKKREKKFKDEFNIFSKCDKLFLTPELYQFYQKTPFSRFMHKAIAVPFPTIQPFKLNGNIPKDLFINTHKINCVFAGRLYERIRNPNYALKLFSEIDNNIHLTLISNYTEEKNASSIRSGTNTITLLPLQPRETALSYIQNANILVNIGNTVEFQIPAKIFEYMSMGKPIIHFSKFHNDPAIKYLSKYPLVLVIHEWEKELPVHKQKIKQFCYCHKEKNLSFSEVSEALCGLDSESVSNKFIENIVDCLGE